MHNPIRSETSDTHELLRFNMLSRKAAILTNKGAKKQEAMDYLDQQFDKINEHLDLLLLQNDTGESSIAENLVQQQGNREGTENLECCAEIVVLTDPDKIQQKGRPKNPKRLMSLVEQERIKMAKAEAKKKKKQNPNTSSKICIGTS